MNAAVARLRTAWRDRAFLRHLTVLMSGTAIAQAASLLAAPLLTRLYSAADFGTFGVFLSIAAILGVVAGARLELTLALPDEPSVAANLLAVNLVAIAAVASLATALLLTFEGPLVAFVNDPAIAPWIPWIPVSVALIGLFQAFTYQSIRDERFGVLAGARITRTLTTVSLQGLLGLLPAGVVGLVGGHVTGQAVGSTSLALRSWRTTVPALRRHVSLVAMRDVALEYLDFVRFGAPQALLNSVSQNVPALVLAALFGPTYVGWYLLAHRVLVLPVNLLSGTFKEAFLARVRTAQREDGDVFTLYLRAVLGFAAVVTIPFLLVMAFGPPLFAFVLGAQWEASGIYAQWLAVGMWIGSMNAPAIVMTQVLRKQRWLMTYDALLLVLRVGALLVVGTQVGDVAAIAAYALVGAAFNLVLLIAMGAFTHGARRTAAL